ncbi:response regulator transcription factor [Leadbettera azotonutricia]|uniref:Two component transcriptional regulator, LuxR family n=1 Tax=Leadbettera azotonutricia (strain ATCC BAA-888 / DSM 13862 / ZAS-9) TaxID=545695 RepID=F5YD93_LEAAZ|nr:response regulator transcription factor [Leadbettera azotonutricia]AEF82506.1 two component transcriptional regulator, LuxR family [Leadbettera azotonutricia ZAS-9]
MNKAEKPTLVLIDDHRMIRKGFGIYLTETNRFALLGEAGSLKDAYALFEKLPGPPHLVLLDIELGEENGLELIPWLEKKYTSENKPVPAVLVYSVFEDPYRVQSSLRMGARGYISKSADEGEIEAALDAVIAGKSYIDKHLAKKMTSLPDFYSRLTRREREILALVQKNYSNSRIARELKVEQRTIENYLSRIYDKTGTTTRGDLVKL